MLISVVTVCFSDVNGLQETAASLFAQSCSDFQWLVIDGGSKDGTFNYLSQVSNNNVKWVSEPDDGIYDAMNKGLNLASGDYVLFLNAGDLLASEDVLQKLTSHIEERDFPDFVYGDSLERTNENEILFKKARSHQKLWYGMFTHHQAMLYKRSCINKQKYNLKYPIGADYAFTAEFLRKASNISYFPYSLCIFEQGGISASQASQGAKDQWKIRRDILNMSISKRLAIRVVQLIRQLVQKLTPKLYNKIRFS